MVSLLRYFSFQERIINFEERKQYGRVFQFYVKSLPISVGLMCCRANCENVITFPHSHPIGCPKLSFLPL